MAAPPAPALMDELVEEILLRTPPDDPARLLRAALVCKRWCRIVSDAAFRRRFREFHRRTPPLLGLLCRCGSWDAPSTAFVSATSFRASPARVNYYKTVDARHGRVLLHAASWDHERELWDDNFLVWDPIAGGDPTRTRLPLLPGTRQSRSNSVAWNAAVLCASNTDADDAVCDHLECHGGPFLVVFVTRGRRWGRHGMCAHVYSSEAAAWSGRIYARLVDDVQLAPSVLAGNSLYFLCSQSVLKFDLATREMSLIALPQETFDRRPNTILRVTEDGGLGLATECSDGHGLYLWSREVGPYGDVVWARSKVIKPVISNEPLGSLHLTGFAHGLDVILVGTSKGIFSIDQKSVRVTEVCKGSWSWFGSFTFPYTSFYTPALGVASSAE